MRSPRRRSPSHAAAPASRARLTIVLVALAAVAVLVGLGPVASSFDRVTPTATGTADAGPVEAAALALPPLRAASVPPAPVRAPAVPVAPASTTAGSAAAEPTTTEEEPEPTATTSGTPEPAGGGAAAQVIALTNAARTENGCDALTPDRRLTRAAQGHSEDQAAQGAMSHTGSDGSDFVERVEAAGHPSPGAENVAAGQRSATAVVTAWLDSPPHRRNILNCSLRTIGVGLAGSGNYWTQDFGR